MYLYVIAAVCIFSNVLNVSHDSTYMTEIFPNDMQSQGRLTVIGIGWAMLWLSHMIATKSRDRNLKCFVS